MRKTFIAVGVLFILCLAFALAVTIDDYAPSAFESWDDNQSGIMYNFWHSLNPFISQKGEVSPYDNADVYGWYNNTFFGLYNWEREVCLIDLTSDVRNVRNVVYDDILEENNIYTTTLTITATKESSYEDNFLYEASWYIMPYTEDALYKVYLNSTNSTEYIVGKKGDKDENWKAIYRLAGDSGYHVKYIKGSFDKAIIDYKDRGSDIVNTMIVSIIDK